MSKLQRARQALSWMESELHSRGLKDDERHRLAADVREILNAYKDMAETLNFCCEQLESEDEERRCMDNIAADKARALLLEDFK